MNKYSIAAAGALVIIAAAAVFGLQNSAGQAVIRVADPRALGWAPFAIAIDQKYFEAEGLRVKVVPVQTGDESLKALASGSVDVALAGIIPYSFIAFDSPSLKIVAQAVYAHDNQVVARRGSGIREPSHLRGKRIGYAKTTASDIGIKQFLRNHGISEDEVTLVQLKPLAMPAALASGQIDAYSAWEPHIYNGQKLLGQDAVVFDDAASTYTWHAAVIADESYVHAHQDELVRFVRAWKRAEVFMQEHPEQARAVVSRETKIPEETLAAIWPKYGFGIGLPDDLATTLATDLAWANAQRTASSTLPLPADRVDRSVWDAYVKASGTR
jgi:NitT/TauT family transport system substrate-binding protein